jgi:hypothetical protein
MQTGGSGDDLESSPNLSSSAAIGCGGGAQVVASQIRDADGRRVTVLEVIHEMASSSCQDESNCEGIVGGMSEEASGSGDGVGGGDQGRDQTNLNNLAWLDMTNC